MQFCPECKTLMKNHAGKSVCSKCGHIGQHGKIKTSEKIEGPKTHIAVVDASQELMSKVREECPKCKHHEAYFWSRQTRAADEGETSFYRCVKCKHTWRKYR